MPPSASPPTPQPSSPSSPYELAGGRAGLTRLANVFYDLVESDPAYARLRAMHGADLAPVRAALAGFLTGWTGGPRDWFEANPGKCMMSAHAAFAIDQQVAREWVGAMSRAIAACRLDMGVALALNQAFARMVANMINRE